MADAQTAGVLQRMHDAGVTKGKQEGRDVANTLKRIIDCFLFGMGQQQGALMQSPNEANQVVLDKLANTIEINSAIVQSVCAIVVSEDGRIVGATPAADAMLGYAQGELAGRNLEIVELIPRDLRETYMSYWRKFWDNPRNIGVTFPLGAAGQTVDSVRVQALHVNGEQLTVKVGWGHPVYLQQQRCVVAQIMHVPLWQLQLEEQQRQQSLGS